MNKIKLKLNEIKLLIIQNVVELILLVGLFFIIRASFLVNIVLGFYTAGLILTGLAIFMLRFPKR